ncbi:Aca2/YdiL-like domain-containing protein, partial [Escherichia coli]|uniref:Aca2/YdiL-like domain-containing protein n=1 Tax=Escherichia coli TaxID=562 RepID=UPI001551E5A1
MNAYELQALRHIFAMTIDECATWIAQTGDSESWRQWENGKCAIPDRVVEQLLAMRQQRKKHLHAIIEKINNRIGKSLYIDLCNCLILICSIQHQMKVNLWTKNSYRLWLTNWPKTSK